MFDLDNIISKPLNKSRVWRKRVIMIFYLLPSLIFGIIELLSFGFQLGWQKFEKLPYMLIPIYLIIFGLMALWLKWDESKDDENERKQFIEDIKKAVSESVMEAFKKDRESHNSHE